MGRRGVGLPLSKGRDGGLLVSSPGGLYLRLAFNCPAKLHGPRGRASACDFSRQLGMFVNLG